MQAAVQTQERHISISSMREPDSLELIRFQYMWNNRVQTPTKKNKDGQEVENKYYFDGKHVVGLLSKLPLQPQVGDVIFKTWHHPDKGWQKRKSSEIVSIIESKPVTGYGKSFDAYFFVEVRDF